MSNHYHVILHLDADAAKNADPKEIVRRWYQLYKGKDVSQRYLNGETLEPHELDQIDVLIQTWRSRLYDISWFMKVLNEKIARLANKENECTGHLWESHYKSQALLDEKAVLSAMAYVDLNPIRAAMAATPETFDHTSIKIRINYWKRKAAQSLSDQNERSPGVTTLMSAPRDNGDRQSRQLRLYFNIRS